jgi:hypothetical protein
MSAIFLSLFLELQFFRQRFEPYQILNEIDHSLELEKQLFPAMSSPNNHPIQWESYNEWTCFSINNVMLSTTGINYEGEERQIPSFRVLKEKMNAYYELSPSYKWEVEEIMRNWESLLENENFICFLAALLPASHHTGDYELWYITKLKTLRGDWDEENEIDF